jgi:hypothetical protein
MPPKLRIVAIGDDKEPVGVPLINDPGGGFAASFITGQILYVCGGLSIGRVGL